jgi:hypothetical protein
MVDFILHHAGVNFFQKMQSHKKQGVFTVYPLISASRRPVAKKPI